MNADDAMKMVIRDNLLKRIAIRIKESIGSPEPYLLSQAIAEYQLTESECQKILFRIISR
jgi:hypothetical protein